MDIELDYNSDKITIKDGVNPDVEFDVGGANWYPLQNLQKILEEIFNRLDYSRLSSASNGFNVNLTKTEEDVLTIIGEW